jgi:polyisoprenoid-binding protein YceI
MITLISILVLFLHFAPMQKNGTGSTVPVYTSVRSEVRLFAHIPLEDIEATSTNVEATVEMETGKLLFIIPIKSFEFEKRFMQNHFNDQYLESDKYPEARFVGQFNEPLPEIKGAKNISYEGVLTIHGVSRKINGTAKLISSRKIIYGSSILNIRLEDYKIKVPRMVFKNIAEVVEVKVMIQFNREPKS